MNILIVSEPGVNGVFRYVEALCEFLLARGERVHLAYSDVRGSGRLPALVHRIEAAGGMTLNLKVDSRPLPRDFRALIQLWKFARRIKPDIIHSHSSKAGALSRALAWCGMRSSQLYHPHAYRGMQPGAGKLISIFNLAESLFGLTGGTINISRDEQAFAVNRLRIAKHRSFLIPNGVDCRRFHPVDGQRKKSLREKFNLPSHAPVLGTVCRSSAQKDPLTLYQAFAIALQKCPEAYLFHVGEGELDGELETLIETLGLRPRLIRVPYLQNTAEAYQALDGFILTSRYEGFSLAALEAMATNLPVIISEAPGTSDITRLPLSHLWKSQPGNAAGFAEAIGCWYQSLQNQNPINHAQIAQELYDSRVAFQRIADLYKLRCVESGDSAPVSLPFGESTTALACSRLLIAIGYGGMIAALVLTLKASGNIPSTRFIPDKLTLWVNHHGQLRNFFAYALLAWPFLFSDSRFAWRLRMVVGLSFFATAAECAQLFIRTRHFDLVDIAMSIAGIVSAWIIAEVVTQCIRSYRTPTKRLMNYLGIRGFSVADASRSSR